MNKFKYYTDALKKYAKFKGKANRSEFWYFVLFNFVISFIIGLIYQDLANLYSLAVFVPSIAIGARRLHDIGKSGWWQLLGIVPVIIMIILFFLMISTPSTLLFLGNTPSRALIIAIPLVSFASIIWLIILFARKGASVVESEKAETTETKAEETTEDTETPAAEVVEEKKEYFSETSSEESNNVAENTEE